MKNVFLNEYNIRMGKMCYLPLVSGLLQAHAETSEIVRAHYKFQQPIFYVDGFEEIMGKYTVEPHVAAFSVAMWNEQLNLKVAAEVKRRWPNCLIIFGGPNVPHHPTDYMNVNDFIDIAVKAEGEEPFYDILQRFVEGRDFRNIPGVSFRQHDGSIYIETSERPFKRELDSYPSPYLEGLYDDILKLRSEHLDFQAIIETNRGCPFKCTFCYWGRGGLSRKYRYFEQDRVFAEIEWCGRNGIRYVFNADSNFGMHKRDDEIANFIINTKKTYGFPEKFRTCFGKNTDEAIFKIGVNLHRNDLEKGITLARQSNDAEVLKNIKRGNIKMSTYQSLQARFNDENVPVYTEIIVGLPGETMSSWKAGIDEIIASGLKNQLFIYLCQVFHNTELADPEYMSKFSIKTKRIELNEIHSSFRHPSWIKEYEDIIIETASMPQSDWRRMVVFSWVTMMLYSMKLGFYVMTWMSDHLDVTPSDFIEYIADGAQYQNKEFSAFGREIGAYNALIDDMLERGTGRGLVMRDYGEFYWDVEEATFLRAAEAKDVFYEELRQLARAYLMAREISFDPNLLDQVIDYQKARIPTADAGSETHHSYTYNLPEYFDAKLASTSIPLLSVSQDMVARPLSFGGDKARFARETILWGRKSGTMLVKVDYARTALSLAHEIQSLQIPAE